MITQFKKDIELGLSESPKTLPSKYFYDKKGDELFVQIMNMPEYYLSRAELDIFKEQSQEIIQALELNPNQYFELIELGAGDGTKTKELLKVLDKNGYDFDYIPIDISQNALDQLEEKLSQELPNVSVEKKQGDYFEMMATLHETKHPKVVLFLGSNIGNMTDELATDFIYKLGANLRPNDRLFLGVDLIKSAEIVLPAYSDSAGITKAFNLNLLTRINKELDGNFNIDTFSHLAQYSEDDGIALSYLVSTVEQKVTLNASEKIFHFAKGEKIHTEISRKYNDEIINNILQDTDFQIKNKLTDSKDYFANYILKRD
jgi:dimethylhistidine N-methyltransferase